MLHSEGVTLSRWTLVDASERAQTLAGPHIIITALTTDSKIHIKSITPFSHFCCFLSSPSSLVSHKQRLHHDMPLAVHGYIMKMQ